jgi:protein-histidine pros-kinase
MMIIHSKNIMNSLLTTVMVTVTVLASFYHYCAGVFFMLGSIAGYFLSKLKNQIPEASATPPAFEYLPKKNLSHEVRTPLAAVVGTIGYLIENPDKDTVIESLEALTTSCLNLEAVVLDLLESSTGHDQQLFSHPAPTDISRLCSKLAHTIKDKGTEKGVQIKASISPNIPANGLLDRVRTYQLLHRVLVSVLHHLDDAHGEVSLSFLVAERQGTPNLNDLLVNLSAPSTTPEKLLPPSAMYFITRLLTSLDGTVTCTQHDTSALISVSIPFKNPLIQEKTEETEFCIDVASEVLIISDSPEISGQISSCLKILGYSRRVILDSDSFLSSSSRNLDPSLIITILDSTHQNFSSLLAITGSYPDSKKIFLADSLDDATRKLFIQNRLSPPLLLPLGVGDLQQKLLKPKLEKSRTVTTQSGLRILVVDDVRINRIVLAKHLEAVGHEVVTACNGEEALEVLSQAGHFSSGDGVDYEKCFNLVIMDIDMPILGGLAATEQIRSREQLLATTGQVRHVPIIAATADAVGNDYDKFIMAGMEWFLTKPVDPNRLLQLVEHFGGISTRRQSTTGEPNQHIQLNWLYEQFGGDEEAVLEIIEAFLDEIDSLWLSLFKGAIHGTCEKIRADAHALKGSLQNVGAHPAAEVARQVEAAAKAGKTSEARELIESLTSKIKSAKECAVKLHTERSTPKNATSLTV